MGLVRCLNERALSSRIYAPANLVWEGLDWSLYGWVCYSHRRAVLLAIEGPMYPAAIKKRALFRDRTLRMSANNARDVVKAFLQRGILEKVEIRRHHLVHYQLTSLGETLQRTLLRGETT